MNPYRIILADDHTMFRNGIRKFIDKTQDLAVVGEAVDGIELINLLKKTAADMVILDISMPRLRGLEATREIKVIHPEIKILILSMHNSMDYLCEALAAGANGYLLKVDTDTEILSAIDTIRKEQPYLSPQFSKETTHSFLNYALKMGSGRLQPLSTREEEVLTLLGEGKSNKEIADLLFISPRTVEHHRASINQKLNIKNFADLVKYAVRKGYTSDGS